MFFFQRLPLALISFILRCREKWVRELMVEMTMNYDR